MDLNDIFVIYLIMTKLVKNQNREEVLKLPFNEKDRRRCDRCGKWVYGCGLITLPEELYPILEADNEFGICEQCASKYSVEQWKAWIPKARIKFKDEKYKYRAW